LSHSQCQLQFGPDESRPVGVGFNRWLEKVIGCRALDSSECAGTDFREAATRGGDLLWRQVFPSRFLHADLQTVEVAFGIHSVTPKFFVAS
jgi:hypothetical protein